MGMYVVQTKKEGEIQGHDLKFWATVFTCATCNVDSSGFEAFAAHCQVWAQYFLVICIFFFLLSVVLQWAIVFLRVAFSLCVCA